MTDLPNQRAFYDELPQAISSAARYHEPLALAWSTATTSKT